MNKALNSGKIHPLHRSRIAAMPLTYEVVHLFSSPQGHLVEVKHLDRQADTAHEWLWVTEQSVTTLRPRHGDGGTFREAHLQIDGQRAELAWPNGEQLALTASPMQALPTLQHQLIHNHLS
ncbi:hypothetical protein N5E31_03535 [Pseudomonas chengduensis]|uniref:hypothetical protein n=1 Tax=Pseudomonas sediminis TaxID=1691904 RepID=UPI00244D4961|nr:MULTISPECIES: hypothetical protein [Pseudomonas]MDG9757834.1 hypothetical protein [Pseudomonas sediminis]MDH0622960.1 hypothetical protein [Pseudomonas chengduensis]MDH1664545.1 hypothetical protein [Pseudomonas chengduensis]